MDTSASTAKPPKRITEYANSFTDAMDSATPEEFVRLLRQVDQQLFVGFEAYPSVYDKIDTLEKFTTEAAKKIQRAVTGTTSIVIVFSVGYAASHNLTIFPLYCKRDSCSN
eukprot:m.430271 g.430271  ORF g.430271 m.430271 type:complete len:111 (+) comp21392_c0_seq5:188-520(+)